jgi:hypothetical protein
MSANHNSHHRQEQGMTQTIKLEQLAGAGPALTIEAVATPAQVQAITEAALIRGMRRALQPFKTRADALYPRAGVRRRPDGRWHCRIWLDPTLPELVGTPCDALAAAVEFGHMSAGIKRQAAE